MDLFIPSLTETKQIVIKEYDDVMETRALLKNNLYKMENGKFLIEVNILGVWDVDTVEEDLKEMKK